MTELACTCEPNARDECGRFACVVCARQAPACCGAADEHETEGVGVSGVCDDCAARAAWEAELW
jgi:hypothetical protein